MQGQANYLKIFGVGCKAHKKQSLNDLAVNCAGDLLLTRDYMTLKVWDVRQERAPVETYLVHEPLRAKLGMLYENDSIFDKFECGWAGDDRYASALSSTSRFLGPGSVKSIMHPSIHYVQPYRYLHLHTYYNLLGPYLNIYWPMPLLKTQHATEAQNCWLLSIMHNPGFSPIPDHCSFILCTKFNLSLQ